MSHLSAGRLHLGNARGNHYTFSSSFLPPPLNNNNNKKKGHHHTDMHQLLLSVYLGFAFLGNPLPHAKVSQWVSSSFRI